MNGGLFEGLADGGEHERFDVHVARLGGLPDQGAQLLDILDRADLRGRGGASFPVGAKWRTVASQRRGESVVLVNGAEGEPLSRKDEVLLARRPHLVVDGAFLAARTVGAREVIFYVGDQMHAARSALQSALAERGDAPVPMRTILAPGRYVAGEESAAVHAVNEAVALPTTVPPRPFERGVGGRPTLVQNVESLAHVALIARRGDAWFREQGHDGAPGTALVTVCSGVDDPSVHEVAQGALVGDVVVAARRSTGAQQAVLLGGFFGAWVSASEAWTLPLDAVRLRASGRSLGCGVVGLLGADRCGVWATAQIAAYLAGQSAQQCGPCVFGLRAIADALQRLASGRPEPHDLGRLLTWATEVRGRGACRHPDGVSSFVLSALTVFDVEYARHASGAGCSLPPPAPGAHRWTS